MSSALFVLGHLVQSGPITPSCLPASTFFAPSAFSIGLGLRNAAISAAGLASDLLVQLAENH